MKIEALRASPSQSVAAIDKAMHEGNFKTWKIVKDTNGNVFYTHTSEQWNEKAFIGGEARQDRVIFTIAYWTGEPAPPIEIQGYYLGRFTEILLVYFRNYFSKLEVFG
jgi:hypothetical protein